MVKGIKFTLKSNSQRLIEIFYKIIESDIDKVWSITELVQDMNKSIQRTGLNSRQVGNLIRIQKRYTYHKNHGTITTYIFKRNKEGLKDGK